MRLARSGGPWLDFAQSLDKWRVCQDAGYGLIHITRFFRLASIAGLRALGFAADEAF
ncbi:MAG: hypothetical protein ACFLMY_05210 [Candidatus Brachytrichaceae bacterium NZ_4S206]